MPFMSVRKRFRRYSSGRLSNLMTTTLHLFLSVWYGVGKVLEYESTYYRSPTLVEHFIHAWHQGDLERICSISLNDIRWNIVHFKEFFPSSSRCRVTRSDRGTRDNARDYTQIMKQTWFNVVTQWSEKLNQDGKPQEVTLFKIILQKSGEIDLMTAIYFYFALSSFAL